MPSNGWCMEVECKTRMEGGNFLCSVSIRSAEQRHHGIGSRKVQVSCSSAETPVYDRDRITASVYPSRLHP